MPTKFRLQLLSHGEIFTNRDEALEYIEKNFKHDSLYAEPALFLYGNKKQPYFILAFGVGDKEITYIDSGDIDESINNIINGDEHRDADINTIKEHLNGIIKSVGLFYDEDKTRNQISYEPDNKDVLIRDAESLAEAVDIISKYVQKYAEEASLTIAETNSAKLTLLDNNNGEGKTLRAAVKISSNGDSDGEGFNNNIIGIKSDGLYAAAHLEYNDDKNQLTFYSSGMKNGRFQDDAKKQVIDLGKHSEVVSDNSDENPIEINVKNDGSTKKISGKLKISEDSNNIIKVQDGALLVDGRAKNIKYKDSTVFNALNSLDTKVDEIEHKSELIEKDSDTIDFSITKDANGCTIIGGEVKRSSDNSLKISDGGLSVNLSMKINPADNTLTVKLGDKVEVLTLPSVDFSTLINKVTYDAVNKTIHIFFTDGKEITIPVEDLFKMYTFESDIDSPIKLTTTVAADGFSIVKSNIVLKPTDNLVKVDNGQLYVSESNIDNKIKVAKNDVENKLNDLSNSTSEEIQSLKDKDITLENLANSNKDAITNEVSRAELAENELSARINANGSEITNLKNQVTSIEEVNKQQDSELDALTSDNEANKVLISGLQTSTSNNATAIANEVTRATGEEKRIETIANDNKNALTSLSEHVNVVEGDLTKRLSDNENAIAVLNGSSTTTGSVREMISVAINGTVMPAIDAEKDAREKKDAEIEGKIKDLETSVGEGNDSTLEIAKTYTDKETERATGVEAELYKEITTLQDRTASNETELTKKIETVTVEKNSASDLQYTLYVDGKPAGEINIPKDQTFKDVSYDSTSKKLTFIFEVGGSEKTVDIDIADLVDTYVAGNGLSLTDNVFSVKIAVGSESYLTLTEDGLMLIGIDEALSKKANSDDVYTKEESDNKFLTEHQDISHLAKQSDLEVVSDRVSVNEDKLTILTGNEAVEGSVANAIKVSNEYTDNSVANEKQERLTTETTLRDSIQTKANSSDVYSKTEIDAKGYLTEHQDISYLATKADVKNVENEITAVDERVEVNKNNISTLENTVNSMKFHVADSDTVSTVLKATETTNELVSNVKIANVDGNIIKFNGSGIYANVTFEYNKATNKISFNNGNGVNEFELSSHSLVNGGYYDSNTQEIVLIITKDGGATDEIRIKVSDLFNNFRVVNAKDNPIKLYDNVGSDSVREISASVEVSIEPHNLILKDNGTLYASNRAVDHTALNAAGAEVTLQELLNSLNSGLSETNTNISNINKSVANLTEKVDANTIKINENTGAINTITEQIQNVYNQVQTLTERVNKFDTDLENIKELIGDVDPSKPTIQERLDAIEDVINKLIDFGVY